MEVEGAPLREQLVRELASLKRGPGLQSDKRVRQAETLLRLACVQLWLAERYPDARLDENMLVRGVQELVAHLTRGLSPPELAKILAQAYGLREGSYCSKLEDRRQVLLGEMTMSRSTVQRREEDAIKQLAWKLAQMEATGAPLVEMQRYPERRPMDVPKVIMDTEIVLRYTEGRTPREWVETHILEALEHGVQQKPFIWHDAVNIESKLIALSGGQIDAEDVKELPYGVRMGVIRFPKPLRRGESHTVRFARRFIRLEGEIPAWMGWSTLGGARSIRLRVEFDPEALPTAAERYIALTAVPTMELETPEPVRVLDGYYITAEWRNNIEVGKHYGLRWEW